MKNSRTVLPIFLIIVLCLAWFSFISGTMSQISAYSACLDNAENSIEAGLYEQAVEYYKESLQYKVSESTYLKIKETYDLLYAEEHTPFIRSIYQEDMAAAATEFPKNDVFWLTQAELYMDADNYSKAYAVVSQAYNHDASSEALDALYNTLLYMVKVDYKLYTEFKTALNGYITVFDGSAWCVLDDYGEAVTSRYAFIGLINDDGRGLYTNKIDTRFLDITEVPRARFHLTAEEAGYYTENSGLLPVKTEGTWKYMNLDGEFLPGEFEAAGSFYGDQAVAKTQSGWVLINTAGEQTPLTGFEDIKLDLYGCHIQNDVIIGSKNGKYHLYDTEFNQIGSFEADDMDICIDPERIAFCKNGKWGFVNAQGEVVAEPAYAQARSFSNKYAAVCNEDGLWGFINRDFEVVINYQYADAYYFTQAETCMVSETAGIYQLINFMFE